MLKVTETSLLRGFLVKDLLEVRSQEVFNEKRVALALELAANPAVIFLHDPYIGMDVQQMTRFTAILEVSWSVCGERKETGGGR